MVTLPFQRSMPIAYPAFRDKAREVIHKIETAGIDHPVLVA